MTDLPTSGHTQEMGATAASAGVCGQPAFDSVYDAHFDFVWRSLARLGVPADRLEDAVQDVFLVVHRRLGDFEARSSIKTWLFGIALRVARDARRSLHRKGGLEELPADLPGRHESPDDTAARAEAVQLLYALLATLDQDKREVLVMVELEQLSVVEVAGVLGANTNTVHSRLRAARLAFDKAVSRHRARSRSGES